jgi:glycyl-tRNA synthetase
LLRISSDGNSVEEITAGECLTREIIPNKVVAYYLAILNDFYSKTGIDMQRTRFRRLGDDEKAFYASTAFDFEVETSIGWLELVACNYRSDYDLKIWR